MLKHDISLDVEMSQQFLRMTYNAFRYEEEL